jgi:hypothetical protein
MFLHYEWQFVDMETTSNAVESVRVVELSHEEDASTSGTSIVPTESHAEVENNSDKHVQSSQTARTTAEKNADNENNGRHDDEHAQIVSNNSQNATEEQQTVQSKITLSVSHR